MNTTETLKELKELKTKLDNVKELLDLEGQRLMDVQKYILIIDENEDILDDENRQQHYENIIMFNAELELYEDAVKRYNDTVNKYNTRVEFQKFLDSFTV